MAFPDSIQPGFDFDEARTLLEIAQQTYDGTPDNPFSKVCIPAGCRCPSHPPAGNWSER